MIRQGVPIEVVARLLTHRSSTTTSQTYIHLDAADVREALPEPGCGTRAGTRNEHPGAARRNDRGFRWCQRRGRRARRRVDASDHWDATRLGVPARRGRGAARFDAITQDWLREAVKRWSRFRLATGCAFTTINAGALALSRFSGVPG